MEFSKPALMMLDDRVLSDHNRSELSIDIEILERRARTANGTLRKYHVGEKRTFSVSWTDLPGAWPHTVDEHYGAKTLETYLKDTHGEMTLTLRYNTDDEDDEVYLVMKKDFSLTLNKRGSKDLYDVSLSLEEC